MGRYLCTLRNSTRVVLNYTPVRSGADESVVLSYMSGGSVAQSTIEKNRKVLDEVIDLIREIEDGRSVLLPNGVYSWPGLLTPVGVFDVAPHFLRRWGEEGKK